MRVKFTETFQYETEGRGQGPTFEAGEVKDFRDDIAHRFIARNVAVAVGAAEPARAATKPAAPPTADAKAATDAKSDAGKPAPAAGGKA